MLALEHILTNQGEGRAGTTFDGYRLANLGMHGVKRWIWNGTRIIFFNLLILAVLLLISEATYRALHPKYTLSVRTFPEESPNRRLSWAQPSAVLGWTFSGENYDTFVNQRYNNLWSASTNPQGFRSTSDYDRLGSKGSIKRVMVLGDSFAFGTYLNDHDTLPSALQAKLGDQYEVYSFAIPGWGIDQMYVAYEQYVDKIHPDFVLVVYVSDDISRVFESFRAGEGLSKPSFTVVDGLLKSRDGDKPGILEWVSQRSALANVFYNEYYKAKECMRIVEAIFSNLADETRRRGQQLIVVRYPYKGEVLGTYCRCDKFELDVLFREKEIAYLDPYEAMHSAYREMLVRREDGFANFYLIEDDHPASKGNEFVANYSQRRDAML
jgi:hypothetical protein